MNSKVTNPGPAGPEVTLASLTIYRQLEDTGCVSGLQKSPVINWESIECLLVT